MTEVFNLKECYREGHKAFWQRSLYANSPYQYGSAASDAWKEGFAAARKFCCPEPETPKLEGQVFKEQYYSALDAGGPNSDILSIVHNIDESWGLELGEIVTLSKIAILKTFRVKVTHINPTRYELVEE